MTLESIEMSVDRLRGLSASLDSAVNSVADSIAQVESQCNMSMVPIPECSGLNSAAFRDSVNFNISLVS